MLRVQPIDSLDCPELAPYRTMRQQADHYQQRIFVAEGEKLVRRLLETDLTILSVLLPPDHFEALRPLFERRSEPIDVFLGEKRVLETLTGFSMYQGLLACARIPAPVDLDVALAQASRPRFLVAVDALSKAENLGGIVRTAAAFGAQALMVGETCASPYLRRAVRGSMGAILTMPVVEPLSLSQAIRELRRRGFLCIAAHPHEHGLILPHVTFETDCCIVLGSEDQGLSRDVRDACDHCVAIPMRPEVDSLNVGAAAAIFFYEVWRQRFMRGRQPP